MTTKVTDKQRAILVAIAVMLFFAAAIVLLAFAGDSEIF